MLLLRINSALHAPNRTAAGRAGRFLSFQLAKLGRVWRGEAAKRMPVARGDIREIVDQPVFVPLYKLFLAYGKVRRRALQGRAARCSTAQR